MIKMGGIWRRMVAWCKIRQRTMLWWLPQPATAGVVRALRPLAAKQCPGTHVRVSSPWRGSAAIRPQPEVLAVRGSWGK